MNKLLFLVIILFLHTVISQAAPSGYTLITPQPSQGVNVYTSTPGSGNIRYVIEVDAKHTNINFGLSSSGYSKKSILRYWNEDKNYKTQAIINGQFFNMNNGKLAFPVKANYSVLKNTYDESWTYKSFSTLFNQKYGYMFNGFSRSTFNNSRDYILGLHPKYHNKSKYSYVPRTFMAIKKPFCLRVLCELDKYYFFVDDSSTQRMMVNNIKRWGIEENNIMMLDGGDSTQICAKNIPGICQDFGNARSVPMQL